MTATAALAQDARSAARPAAAEQLFALANQSRAEAGAQPLKWDAALAAAAMKHCERMAVEGPIAHRYGGEPDVSERAAQAGAHFSRIEENIAVGSYPASIHDGWMHSPPHRANLLNPNVNRVGIAVVAAHGVLFAAVDFSEAVPVLSAAQVEERVGELIRMSGITVSADHADARAACQLNHGLPPISGGDPQFVMRWQGADIDHLPQDLVTRLGTREFRQAEVGSCPAQNAEGAFTVYRLAVLLYSAPARIRNNW
ncbi:MAG TPA: CAP domain-containing protein [Terracidiphilus sp.]|nr:CAP domain-containing protein [Terracidiphilus sp.]